MGRRDDKVPVRSRNRAASWLRRGVGFTQEIRIWAVSTRLGAQSDFGTAKGKAALADQRAPLLLDQHEHQEGAGQYHPEQQPARPFDLEPLHHHHSRLLQKPVSNRLRTTDPAAIPSPAQLMSNNITRSVNIAARYGPACLLL